MKKRYVVSVFALLLPVSVYAAGSGSLPKGKPFVEIQGQFVEVQNEVNDIKEDISKLTGEVNSLEEKISANSTAIEKLKSENVVIEQKIDETLRIAAQNSVDVAGALQRIQEINQQLTQLNEDVQANSSTIDSLNQELGQLRDFVVANTEGLLSLQAQVENNLSLINELQTEIEEVNASLATKQNFLNAQCPSGSALRVINQDGSFECETSVSSGPYGLRRITVNTSVTVPATYTYTYTYRCGLFSWCTSYNTIRPEVTGTATCPAGSLLESGGYNNPASAEMLQSQAQGNAWVVAARSTSNYPVPLYVSAECLQVYNMNP